jgi:hypothetical protein
MPDHTNYRGMTNSELANELTTLVGNTELLTAATERIRAREDFLTVLDSMTESTEEFIMGDTYPADNFSERLDKLVREDHNRDRLEDLLALERVNKLFEQVFQIKES